jgi:predicted metal-dependent peptidase
MAMTAEQRLLRAHTQIIRDQDFVALSGLLMVGTNAIRDDIPTAMTNGRDVFYGRSFVDNLKDEELRFVIVHELMHKAMKHCESHTYAALRKENNAKLGWAMDYVINLQLLDMDAGRGFIKMPKVGLIDEKYRGMNTAQVYRAMPHSPQQGFDEHDWIEDLTDAEKRELFDDIDRSLHQGALQAARLKGKGNRAFEELLEPQVDWRMVLAEFVKQLCAGRDMSSWRRLNKRFAWAGISLPSSVSEQIGEVVVAVDTSGSIDAEMIQTFMSEVACIADEVRPDAIHLLAWGSDVVGHDVYKSDQYDALKAVRELADGGGTDPSTIPPFMTKHNIKPVCAIVLTDGEFCGVGSGWPEHVLWCVMNNKRFVAPVGRVVHIEA